MSFLPTVIRATYRGDYHIEIVFHDGLVATVDFARWMNGPVLGPPLIGRRFGWQGSH